MENFDPIWELISDKRKAIISPIVRYFRCGCCEDSTHCINVGKAGYRRGMLADLGEIRDAMLQACLSAGMKGFKVISPNKLMSLSSSMEEDEVARLMGEDPMHLSAEGFVIMAEKLTTILEDRRTTFQGEKRTREVREAQADEGEGIISWGRRKSDWIFFTVSGRDGRRCRNLASPLQGEAREDEIEDVMEDAREDEMEDGLEREGRTEDALEGDTGTGMRVAGGLTSTTTNRQVGRVHRVH
jgi:hypothetical protein